MFLKAMWLVFFITKLLLKCYIRIDKYYRELIVMKNPISFISTACGRSSSTNMNLLITQFIQYLVVDHKIISKYVDVNFTWVDKYPHGISKYRSLHKALLSSIRSALNIPLIHLFYIIWLYFV